MRLALGAEVAAVNRSTPLKRTAFGPHRPKPTRRPLLVAKNLGKSAKDYKRVPRNQKHMARVAALGCMFCSRPAQFHHVDILTPKTMGPKVSDYIGCPLCDDHHKGDVRDSAHGYGGERAFWERHGVDIGAWIVRTLLRWYPDPDEPVAAAIAAIEKQRSL